MLQLEIVFEDKKWRSIPRLQSRLEKAAAATQAALPKNLSFPVSVTLLLADNKAVQKLNRDFRGLNKPTNVLSFPQYKPRQLAKIGKEGGLVELGDIALAYQYVVVEAKKYHKILINHVTHLFIHGFLHLLGYDHLLDKDANRMEKLEQQIMAALKLPDPYQDGMPTKRANNTRRNKTKKT